jgi:hypothetical protein
VCRRPAAPRPLVGRAHRLIHGIRPQALPLFCSKRTVIARSRQSQFPNPVTEHTPPIGEPYPWVPGWRRVMPRARRPRMPLSTSTRQAKSREAVTAISATPPGTLKMRAPAHLSALAASRRGDGTDFPARRSPSAGCGGQGPPGRRSRGVRPAGAQPLLCQRASSIRHVAGRTHTKRHAGPGEIAMYRILGALAPACK